jgi:signal peptidase I, archaeal type
MRIKNILSNIFLAFAVATLIGAVIFVSTGDRNDHNRYFMNLRFYQTTTGSMEPYMKTKSIVVVKKADIDDFAVGDVVSFARAGNAIAHRVIGITEEGLQTKGDNNRVDDAAIVTRDEIIGKCVLVMNWVAVFLNNLETPTGVIRVIVLPVLFFITVLLAINYFKMVKITKEEEKQQDEE